ncbi:multifunctional CCA tRNA nucleotidyl transferase/2'3'-cyclic phosphodiesterase/2'nucleotidase/phosphatase [Massilia sp. DD77]|uniref:multifunctional CCA tRNA nucleotidyl transferase/2'3'-cyclic phosphodiesterase/2'nucleotidase/phosphatase n=1 Tax=Massilia sp. DD77 TaxID=3109349 RepID=UPI002FFEE21B
MRSYVVGGAVRDQLLGLPVQDRDHVVVGATPEQMLAAGFRPVGKDFPVFLHPATHEEYALARTERKTAKGYHGFAFHTAPDVTLEQDLVRRDLTINAMALGEDGAIVDPYGGQRDLDERIFRHVSEAFAEDPVRILRVARFAARLPDFRVADATNALMRRMVDEGEVDALVAERVWQELARGLMEARPSRMLAVLDDCGALARILPELDSSARTMDMIDEAARRAHPLEVRFAVLMCGLQAGGAGLQAVQDVCTRLKTPNECRDLAVMTVRELGLAAPQAGVPDAPALVALFQRCDAFRKPERFVQMLQAAACTVRDADLPPALQEARLLPTLAAARGVNAGEIAQRCAGNKAQIPAAVHAGRVEAVAAVLDAMS